MATINIADIDHITTQKRVVIINIKDNFLCSCFSISLTHGNKNVHPRHIIPIIVTTSNTAGVNANAEVIPNTNRPTTANKLIIAKF